MFRALHRDESGKVNALHFILAAVAIVACYAVFMYYPPYMQYWKIKDAAKELALQGSTVETDDARGKAYYDSRIRDLGLDFPLSTHLTYYRHDRDTVEVSFEYDYGIDHFFMSSPHVLHFSFRCVAYRGHCQE